MKTHSRTSLTQKGHAIDLLFTIALLCVFAISCVAVVMVGADVYQNTVESMDENYNTRTTLVYLWEKVKQGDTADGLEIRQREDSSALVITQRFGDTAFETWIYTAENTLREVMVPAGQPFADDAGAIILEVEGVSIREENGLFVFSVPDEKGLPVELTVAPRSLRS